MTATALLQTLTTAALAVAVLGGVLRTLLPGTLLDRIIGFDVAVLGFVGLVAVHTATSGRTSLVDVLPVLGLLAVLGTIAVARAVGAGR